MNKYKVQYWLYACLNKKFGVEVKIKRDSLHHIYEVNRHGMEVSTNTTKISDVRDWLLLNLNKSGYNSNSSEINTYSTLTKRIANKVFYISVSPIIKNPNSINGEFCLNVHGYDT